MKTIEFKPKQLACSFMAASKFYYLILLLISLLTLGSCRKADDLSNIVSSSANSSVVKSKKPNIVFILGDDVGYEIPTCDGGESYSTPNIDKLAAEGVRYTQCFSTPLCSPSRFMLLTAKYNFRNYDSWGIMDTSSRTIANMLRDNGYKTLVAGKWQLDGGDASIHALGFDDYLVYAPFGTSGLGKGSRYKNPTLYTKGALMPSRKTNGKYGEDLLVNYINDFIDSNKTKPFFIYYSVCLVHYPFCPTPDDPDFAAWDPKTSTPDKKYFPSMVNYMDKKIGEVIDKIKADGLASNTLVIYAGDNGTDNRIKSKFDNLMIKGGKSFTYETGTHVPLIVWQPGTIAPKVSDNLVDFTDFMPTIAKATSVKIPSSYGIIDGKSFYFDLVNGSGTARNEVFCHYDQNQQGEGTYPIKRWTNNTNYKLYDTTNLFYNIVTDPYEKSPIPDSKLTPEEKTTKAYFQSVLSTMHN